MTKTGKIKSIGIQDDIDNLISEYRETIRKLGARVNSMPIDTLVQLLTQKKRQKSILSNMRKVKFPS